METPIANTSLNNTSVIDSLSDSAEQRTINQQVNTILDKAKLLRGYSIKELSNYLKVKLPANQYSLVNAKGVTGQIVEILLGATAKSKPLPDFPELELEIKTLPIDLCGKPLETTYICTAPLLPKYKVVNNQLDNNIFNFYQSVVYKKLKKVLWIPIIVSENNRVVGNAFIWQPNQDELDIIKKDWLELTEMLYLGDVDKVSSHLGEVMQIRPKAANSSVTTTGLDKSGNKINTLPRGFYLRSKFTHEIYQKYSVNQAILP